MRLCCCCEYSGPHNEYYHISPSLHLLRIIMLPSRAWRSIKGKCVIWHPCQRITTSEAAPRWKSLVPLVPKTIFNDFPKRQGGVRITATPPLIFRLQIYRIQAKRASISVAAHKIFIAHNKDKQSTKEAAKLADLTTFGDGAMKRLHFNNYPISLTLLSILLP